MFFFYKKTNHLFNFHFHLLEPQTQNQHGAYQRYVPNLNTGANLRFFG